MVKILRKNGAEVKDDKRPLPHRKLLDKRKKDCRHPDGYTCNPTTKETLVFLKRIGDDAHHLQSTAKETHQHFEKRS